MIDILQNCFCVLAVVAIPFLIALKGELRQMR
jgi:hypothetical protein